MSIHVLSTDLINQIAAGEVVERPAHLVKELIENSLDAKSTEVFVETSMGGRFIKVTDNGDGITGPELGLALTRHATSKIEKTDDLWSLSTFGFRGEALASAAAVSKLTLLSKEKNAEGAFQIQSDFGKLSDILAASKKQGTEIKVESLFDNVPARLKFLKSDTTELAQIKNVIRALALVNPQVQFKLIDSGQLELFYSAKKSIKERAEEVLGVKLFSNSASRQNYYADAYFSSPHDVAKTSKGLWIFVQGRWIQDRGLQAAVMEAYRHLLMHGEYPYAVINLKCDPAEVDVNIHPTKSQVKFQDQSLAFRAVQAAVREGLEKAPWIASSPATSIATASVPTNFQQPQNLNFQDRALFTTQTQTKSYTLQDLEKLKVSDTVMQYQSVAKSEPESKTAYWSTFQVVGQVFLTYIVCQKDQEFVLVDQHAAHERVAFEKLMKNWNQQKNQKGYGLDQQQYLFPLAIDLSPEKVEVLMSYQDSIMKMGIDIEPLGPNVLGVKAAPLIVKESALPGVFEKMAADLIEYGGSYNLEKKITDIFATMACHSVIRAGQSLSAPEMKDLLVAMDEFPLSSFCPHGRPVSVSLTQNEIEKLFGRI